MNGKGVVCALAAALCFGIMPVLTKLIYNGTKVDPFFFLMIRYGVAAFALWIFMGLRRDGRWREVNHSDLLIMGGTAVSYLIVTATYFIALQYIDASLTSLLCFTFPVFTPFLGRLLFGQRLQWYQVVAAGIGFAGCALLIGNYRFQGVSGEALGIGLGLLSGVLYSMYTLIGQKVIVRIEPLIATTYNVSFIALFFMILRFHWIWQQPQSWIVYGVAALIGIVSTIFANVFYFEAIRTVGAVKAGIFSSAEPFFTAVLAISFLGESLGPWQWCGALLIGSGMIAIQQPWAVRPRGAEPGAKQLEP